MKKYCYYTNIVTTITISCFMLYNREHITSPEATNNMVADGQESTLH